MKLNHQLPSSQARSEGRSLNAAHSAADWPVAAAMEHSDISDRISSTGAVPLEGFSLGALRAAEHSKVLRGLPVLRRAAHRRLSLGVPGWLHTSALRGCAAPSSPRLLRHRPAARAAAGGSLRHQLPAPCGHPWGATRREWLSPLVAWARRSRTRCLTLRWSGPTTACRLGRQALQVYAAPRGPAGTPRRSPSAQTLGVTQERISRIDSKRTHQGAL
jgi:hypothetical protein